MTKQFYSFIILTVVNLWDPTE